MHLHRLSLTAIGPFPDSHTLDLTALGASGLFLLEGPTGAGKSTIIDAIVFALYGRVASASGSADRLHSHHADPAVTPKVELVFETSSGVYRVSRTPSYERPKQRGTGTTKQQPSVQLARLGALDSTGPGEVISTRVGEADDEIARIVGLSREQFVQTMVLPQNEFTTFLRAKPEERCAVLQRVFGTEIYERVQEQLVTLRRSATQHRDAATQRVRAAAATFAGAAGFEDEDCELLTKLAEQPDRSELDSQVTEACEALAERQLEVATAASEAAQREVELREERDRLATRARLVDRIRELSAEQVRLEAREPEIDRAQQALRAAERALPLAGILTSVEQAEELDAAAAGAAARARAGCPELLREADERGLRVGRESALSVAAGLAGVLELERGLPGLLSTTAELASRIAELDCDVAAQGEQIAAHPALVNEAEQRLAELRAVALLLGPAQQDLERASLLETAAVDRVAALRAVQRRESALGAKVDLARSAVDREHDLRRRRLTGIAAELAADLVPGQPCGVCGGLEHPAPAQPGPEPVSAQTVDAACAAREQAEHAASQAREDLAEAHSRLAVLDQASGGCSVEHAAAAVAVARERVSSAQQANDAIPGAVTALEDHRVRAQKARVRLVEAEKLLATARAEHAASDGQQRTASARVSAAFDGFATVEMRSRALQTQAEALESARDAVAALDAAHRVLEERRSAWRAALDRSGFADADAVRQALLTEIETAALARTVSAHEVACGTVRGALVDPALAGLDVAEVVDVSTVQTALEHAMGVRQERERAAGSAATQHDRAVAESSNLSRALELRETVLIRTAPVIRVADLATASTGDCAHRVTLAAYVLRRRFEDVVDAANDRLRRMSAGRYSLERVDEHDAGRTSKGGLGLRVHDLLTDTPRSPRTLSGGETFYVSLALALGLADVVTAEAGGIELGTLFVDEGFGSLDSETLDAVLGVLADLNTGGRVVGVVSHLAEMKDRIAERVEVRRRPDGASTLRVCA